MNLRLARQIVRKDVRRWRWMVALTIVLLARLVQLDSWRHYAAMGSEDSWLYLLLPLAWSFLIALAVMEDPVVGDTPFWLATPSGWRPVLLAKAIFVAALIHVPYFIGCVVIVQARGFSAFDCLGELFFRQLLLLAVTLPSLAIASLVRNVAQFMMAAILLATAVAAPSVTLERSGSLAQDIRVGVLCLVVAVAGGFIFVRQYSARRTAQNRVAGYAALALAVIIWWLPRESFYGLQSMMFSGSSATPVIESQSSHSGSGLPELRGAQGAAIVSIPIHAAGMNSAAHFEPVSLSLTEPNGHTWHADRWVWRDSAPNNILMYLCCANASLEFQAITVDASLIKRIGNLPLMLKGAVLMEYYRRGETARISPEGERNVEGLGRCSSNFHGGEDNPNTVKIHIECESPHRLPGVEVSVTDPSTGRAWRSDASFGDSFVTYLSGSWLSPMQRWDFYFSPADQDRYRQFGNQWEIPREALRSVGIGITPQIREGSAVVKYEIPNIRLNDFLVGR